MRGIQVHRFGGPEVMALHPIERPVADAGEVVIEVRAAGVNPVDTYIRSGAYARLPALPYVPGWDGAGVVVEAGPGVDRVRAGDRVYFSGTVAGRGVGAYAELACCRADQVFPLPGRLSFAQGAAIGVPYATAHRALFHRAGARAGETALVHGASGAVGLAAVQLALAHGLTVLGTAGSDAGRRLVREQGAHGVMAHGDPGHLAEILAFTDGRGVDLIVEMLANVNLDGDLDLLAPGGRVVVVGSRGRVEIDPRKTMGKESAILGMSLWNAGDAELREVHERLAPGLAGGALTPVVGAEFPLAEAARAHQAVLAGGAAGKVVLGVS